MLRQLFRYNLGLGIIALALSVALVYFAFQAGGCYFDFFSQNAIPYLRSDWIRLCFMLVFALFAVGVAVSFFKR